MRATRSRSPGLSDCVDLLDRHAEGDEAHAEQILQRRAIGRHQRRERALVGAGDRVRRAGGALEVHQPQRIVAEQMIEVVDQPDVRPMIGDADQFDAVAAVGRRGGLSFAFSRVTVSSLVWAAAPRSATGCKPGRLVRRVVPAEIGDAERGQHRGRGERAPRCEPARQRQHRDRRRRQSRCPRGSAARRSAARRRGAPARQRSPTSATAIAISARALPRAAARGTVPVSQRCTR